MLCVYRIEMPALIDSRDFLLIQDFMIQSGKGTQKRPASKKRKLLATDVTGETKENAARNYNAAQNCSKAEAEMPLQLFLQVQQWEKKVARSRIQKCLSLFVVGRFPFSL